MSPPTSLFLLRHAEVEADYQRVFGGRIDMGISPRGHDQAASLAKYLRRQGVQALYASPMKRVQQTLAPFLNHGAGQGNGMMPVVLPGLREVHFGDWTGLGWEQVRTRFNVSPFQWLELLDRAAIPNAEDGPAFRQRVEPCLEEILRAHPGQTVAIACHGGTIRMILSILLGLPLAKTAVFEIEYASVTHVHHSSGKTEVQLLNFAPWRELA